MSQSAQNMTETTEAIMAETDEPSVIDNEFDAAFDTDEAAEESAGQSDVPPASGSDDSDTQDDPPSPPPPAEERGVKDSGAEKGEAKQDDPRAAAEEMGKALLGLASGEPEKPDSKPPADSGVAIAPPENTTSESSPPLFALLEKVKLEGEEVTLAEMTEEWGKKLPGWIQKQIQAGTQALTQKAIEDLVASGKLVPADRVAEYEARIQSKLDLVERELASNAYFRAVEKLGHKDVREIDESKEFHDWVNAQPPTIKALVQSPDPKHGATAIGLFKHETAATKASQVDGERAKEKERKDAIHKHTVRDRTTGRFSAQPEDDFDKVFDEIAV